MVLTRRGLRRSTWGRTSAEGCAGSPGAGHLQRVAQVHLGQDICRGLRRFIWIMAMLQKVAQVHLDHGYVAEGCAGSFVVIAATEGLRRLI